MKKIMRWAFILFFLMVFCEKIHAAILPPANLRLNMGNDIQPGLFIVSDPLDDSYIFGIQIKDENGAVVVASSGPWESNGINIIDNITHFQKSGVYIVRAFSRWMGSEAIAFSEQEFKLYMTIDPPIPAKNFELIPNNDHIKLKTTNDIDDYSIYVVGIYRLNS